MLRLSDLPSSVNFSQVLYESIDSAKESKMEGLGCLTPYWVHNGIKHFAVKVDGYDTSSEGGEDSGYEWYSETEGDDEAGSDNKSILNLDTANLFLGTIHSATESAKPYQSTVIGSLGSLTKALPVRFRRIHFIASQGSGDPEEYYTYVLAANPVKVNNAFDSDECSSEAQEEVYGNKRVWGSDYEPAGGHGDRVIIGGKSFGNVITSCSILESGCKVLLQVTSGVAYLYSSGYLIEEGIRDADFFAPTYYPITFNTGELKYVLEQTVLYIDEKIDNISDVLVALQECACDGGTGASGSSAGECLCNMDLNALTGDDGTGLPPEFCTLDE